MLSDPYTNSKIVYAHDDDNGMQARVLLFIAALVTIGTQPKDDYKKAKNCVFWTLISDIASQMSQRSNLDPVLHVLTRARLTSDNFMTSNEWWPLHSAAACKHSSDDDVRIIGEARPNDHTMGIGEDNVLPYHLAAAVRDPNLHVIHRLRRFSLSAIRVKSTNGNLSLHWAAKFSSSVGMIQELLQDYPRAITARNARGETCAHLLCSNELAVPEMLTMVLAASPTVATIQDNCGNLPLHVLTGRWCQRERMVLQLIEAYPEGPAVVNLSGRTPLLHWLSPSSFESPRHLGMFEILLSSTHTDISLRDPRGANCLHLAGRSGALEVFRSLYDARPEAICERDSSGVTVLHYCSGSDTSSLAMLQLIYQLYPTAIREIEHKGRTVMHYCSRPFIPHQSRIERLHFILQKYPEAVSIPDVHGETAYFMCRSCGCGPVTLRLLLRAAPNLATEELRRLNYAARRLALFVFYVGVRGDGKFTPFSRLSNSPKGEIIVRSVVSFI